MIFVFLTGLSGVCYVNDIVRGCEPPREGGFARERVRCHPCYRRRFFRRSNSGEGNSRRASYFIGGRSPASVSNLLRREVARRGHAKLRIDVCREGGKGLRIGFQQLSDSEMQEALAPSLPRRLHA